MTAAAALSRVERAKAAVRSGAEACGPSPGPGCSAKNALYRARLSCAIGRDAIEGRIEIPANVSPMEWAMFNLLHAVEEIASAIEPNPGIDARQAKEPTKEAR